MARTGRPKQFDVTKLLKLTAAQYDAIQVYAAQHGITDSEAMRQLIDRGLAASTKRTWRGRNLPPE